MVCVCECYSQKAHLENLAAEIDDFRVALMHTPLTGNERIHVEPPREWEKDKRVVWKLCKAVNGLRQGSLRFQNVLLAILTEKLRFKKLASTPTVVSHTETSVKLFVHVDGTPCIEDERRVDNLFTAL